MSVIEDEKLDVVANMGALRSAIKPTASTNEASIWHRRLGHPGPETLEQCARRKLGTNIKGPKTHECEICAVSKAHRHISRALHEPRSSALFGHVAVDLFPIEQAYNGDRYAIVMKCRLTHLTLLDTILDRNHETLLDWMMDKVQYLKTQWDVRIRFFQSDGEKGFEAGPTKRFFRDEGIEQLPTSPHSSYQNGAPERLGGTIMARARCLLRDSGIPEKLWPEVTKTVTYLLNRTPNQQLE